jgi:ring-opening amidohydrolase-like protein
VITLGRTCTALIAMLAALLPATSVGAAEPTLTDVAGCNQEAARRMGATRGRRHVMFDDSDINSTRHIRGAVNAVIAAVTGDPMCYVSAGAEHQGPAGGGVVAVLARAR